jgi:hypothetical protein
MYMLPGFHVWSAVCLVHRLCSLNEAAFSARLVITCRDAVDASNIIGEVAGSAWQASRGVPKRLLVITASGRGAYIIASGTSESTRFFLDANLSQPEHLDL